jgi:hypothetical protein
MALLFRSVTPEPTTDDEPTEAPTELPWDQRLRADLVAAAVRRHERRTCSGHPCSGHPIGPERGRP